MSGGPCILVLNCGSSSVKAALIDPQSGARRATAQASRLGQADAQVEVDGKAQALEASNPSEHHAAGIAAVLDALIEAAGGDAAIAGVGHRVVHGGDRFVAPTRIDAEVESTIDELASLAPLHNPANLAGIKAARARLPDCTHVAVFDE